MIQVYCRNGVQEEGIADHADPRRRPLPLLLQRPQPQAAHHRRLPLLERALRSPHPLLQEPPDQRHRRIRKASGHRAARPGEGGGPRHPRTALHLQAQDTDRAPGQDHLHRQRPQHLRARGPRQEERPLHLIASSNRKANPQSQQKHQDWLDGCLPALRNARQPFDHPQEVALCGHCPLHHHLPPVLRLQTLTLEDLRLARIPRLFFTPCQLEDAQVSEGEKLGVIEDCRGVWRLGQVELDPGDVAAQLGEQIVIVVERKVEGGLAEDVPGDSEAQFGLGGGHARHLQHIGEVLHVFDGGVEFLEGGECGDEAEEGEGLCGDVGVELVVVGEGEGVDLTGEVAEEQVEFAQGLLVLELELQVAHVFEDGQAVRPVHHQHRTLHALHRELDAVAHADLHRLLLLVVEQPVQAAQHPRGGLEQVGGHDAVEGGGGLLEGLGVLLSDFRPNLHLLEVLLGDEALEFEQMGLREAADVLPQVKLGFVDLLVLLPVQVLQIHQFLAQSLQAPRLLLQCSQLRSDGVDGSLKRTHFLLEPALVLQVVEHADEGMQVSACLFAVLASKADVGGLFGEVDAEAVAAAALRDFLEDEIVELDHLASVVLVLQAHQQFVYLVNWDLIFQLFLGRESFSSRLGMCGFEDGRVVPGGGEGGHVMFIQAQSSFQQLIFLHYFLSN